MPVQFFVHRVCPFAHRVWMAAIEKGLIADGSIETVDVELPLPLWYKVDVNPRETLPVLRLASGKIIPESLIMLSYIDEAFPAHPVMPIDPVDRADTRLFVGDFDKFVEGLYALLVEKDTTKHPELIASIETDIAFLERTLTAKSEGPFFLGGEPSFADFAVLPFLDRFRYTLPHFRHYDMLANAPRMRAMLAAAEVRPSFKETTNSKEWYIDQYKSVDA